MKSTNLNLPVGVNNGGVTFAATDTTTLKTVFTADASNGSDLLALLATSSDTATINLKVLLRTGGVDYLIGTVRIVTLSGTDGAAVAIDILNSTAFPGLPINSVGKRYIPMMAGDSLKVGCLATMTANTLTVVALGQNY